MRNDIYGEPDIIRKGNVIAKVYSPVLNDKERDRRMTLIKRATVSLVLSKHSSESCTHITK